MLRLIRERAKGPIAWVIVGLIVVPFALFGINEYFETDANIYVAKVNDVSIPGYEFNRVYQSERAFRQSLVGDNPNSPFMNDDSIKRSALDRLINTEVMSQAAISNGFDVSDQSLLQAIASRQEFQTDGQFDQSLYNNLLRRNNISIEDFEGNVRRDLMAGQFVSGVMDLAIVTNYELDTLLRLQEQTREIGYLVLKVDALKKHGDKALQFSDDQIRKHYDENIDRFALQEQVSLKYVELSASALLNDIEVDEEVLRELYEDRIDSFALPEERHARHILLSTSENASESDIAAARSKADGLLAQLQAGESFEVMAKEYSDDAGSAIDGGDLGYFSRGMMVSAFDEVVFMMEKGAISEPVKTPFGFHIIKLEDIREGSSKSFEEVRAGLALGYREQQAEDVLFDRLEILSNLVYENPDSLLIAAEEMELTVKTVGFFDRHSGSGIATNANVRTAAFSDEVMARNNSEPLQIGESHMVVIRIDEHQPVSYRPLDEVRDDVIALLRDHSAKNEALTLGDSLVKQLEEGADAASIAEQHKVEWTKTELIKRSDSSVNNELLSAAFRIVKSLEGKTQWHGFELVNGDYAVIALYQVKPGDLESIDGAARASLKTTLLRNRSQSEGAYLVDSLKQKASIKEYLDNL